MKRFLLFATLLLAFLGTTPAQIGGYSVELTDADDYISLPEGVYFDDDSFTVEAWVYVKVFDNWSRLIDFGNGGGVDNVLIGLQEGITGKPRF